MKTIVRGGFLVLVLAGSFIIPTPTRIDALTCQPGAHQGHLRLYYNDAAHTTVVCRGVDCLGTDPCEGASPYFTETTICCRPSG